MDIEIYKLVHLLGLIMLFLSLGASVVIGPAEKGAPWRRASAIAHGIGVFFLLLGGFGMLARLGITWPWPGWVIVKMLIWFVLAGAPFSIRRMPNGSRILWGLAIGAGFLAAYLALYKPF